MEKTDVLFVLVGAAIATIVVLAVLYFFWAIVGLAILLAVGFFILFLVVPVIIFVVSFFALFYYMLTKKPKIDMTGNYRLSDEKGKNE